MGLEVVVVDGRRLHVIVAAPLAPMIRVLTASAALTVVVEVGRVVVCCARIAVVIRVRVLVPVVATATAAHRGCHIYSPIAVLLLMLRLRGGRGRGGRLTASTAVRRWLAELARWVVGRTSCLHPTRVVVSAATVELVRVALALVAEMGRSVQLLLVASAHIRVALLLILVLIGLIVLLGEARSSTAWITTPDQITASTVAAMARVLRSLRYVRVLLPMLLRASPRRGHLRLFIGLLDL